MESWMSLAKSLCSLKVRFMGSVWNSLFVGDVTTAVWAWMEFKTSDAYDQ
jgi:hypothetical protein